MERTKFRLIIFVVSFFICCQEKKEYKERDQKIDKVFNDVLYSAIDSLMDKHSLQNKTIIHSEIYPDALKISTIENTILELEGDSTTKTNLIRDLRNIVEDSIIVNIEEKERDYELIFSQSKVEESQQKEAPFIINLSKISYNDSMDTGCFYFAIHCGKKCSAGYLIYIKKQEEGWQIAGIIPRWHS